MLTTSEISMRSSSSGFRRSFSLYHLRYETSSAFVKAVLVRVRATSGGHAFTSLAEREMVLAALMLTLSPAPAAAAPPPSAHISVASAGGEMAGSRLAKHEQSRVPPNTLRHFATCLMTIANTRLRAKRPRARSLQ